ncbi:hypothetical protein [Streptosporangium pseudovulgare]|uniref:Uncharacterized protein n=1 Tax=Streptosporangium pseudovulgare TaxID=35765 RepID=A0ABQ2RE73_9ACTN|nr:hypothetical protein [Streptosporangium pseudovulgare]GGQ22155.1 hypothetical protein GCM10010140_60490 [Streptosporangium pseudovulgare]
MSGTACRTASPGWSRAVDLLGDLGSTASEEVGHFATYTNGLDSHPPARDQMTGPLAAYLVDGPLTIA